MTDRKFTPPTKFPAEYVTGDGRKAVILGGAPDDIFIYVGYMLDGDGGWKVRSWGKDGLSGIYDPNEDLQDLPKKKVHRANDYVEGVGGGGHWLESRHDADANAGPDRIAVIRREWIEGQPPQYFTEEA